MIRTLSRLDRLACSDNVQDGPRCCPATRSKTRYDPSSATVPPAREPLYMSHDQTATAITLDESEPLALQRHYIDGAFRASRAGGTFESRSPATNEVIAIIADGQEADVDHAVT